MRRDGVTVDGPVRPGGVTRGVFIARVRTGLTGSVQSQDTVYTDGAGPGIVGAVIIGVLLSLVGGLIYGLFLIGGVLTLLRRLVSGRGR